uniref:Uncharacterized protein n=1 Tax=Rhizophora mucronata TaxID=61149 RepID=A0A2P2L9X3_RHIMU
MLNTTRSGNPPSLNNSSRNRLLEIFNDCMDNKPERAAETSPERLLWLKSRTSSCFKLESSIGSPPPR